MPPDATGEGEEATKFVPDRDIGGRFESCPCCPGGANREGLTVTPTDREARGT